MNTWAERETRDEGDSDEKCDKQNKNEAHNCRKEEQQPYRHTATANGHTLDEGNRTAELRPTHSPRLWGGRRPGPGLSPHHLHLCFLSLSLSPTLHMTSSAPPLVTNTHIRVVSSLTQLGKCSALTGADARSRILQPRSLLTQTQIQDLLPICCFPPLDVKWIEGELYCKQPAAVKTQVNQSSQVDED